MNLKKYEKILDPFLLYIFRDCIEDETVIEINSIIKTLDKNINIENYNGERTNGNYRYYINKKNIDEHPNIKKNIDFLMNIETIKYVENLGNVSLKNCYLRYEIILDKNNFWLEKHVDIPEKKMSCLLFINDNNEPKENGTDIYDDNLKLVNTIPFKHKTCYMFFPSKNTWHGLEKGKNIKYRKVVLINYVTFKTDWKI